MRKLSETTKSYIAGFLDGDGSIYVKLKPNSTYRFRFQISPAVVFYQSERESKYLQWLQRKIGRGYLRRRKDGVIEFMVGDIRSIKEIIQTLLPYLKLKQKQARLMLRVLKMKEKVKNADDFLRLAKEIDKFQEINYSKKRIQNSERVKKTLIKERLLAP